MVRIYHVLYNSYRMGGGIFNLQCGKFNILKQLIMVQNIIVHIIIFSALIFTIITFYRKLTVKKTRKCDGCAGCSLKYAGNRKTEQRGC